LFEFSSKLKLVWLTLFINSTLDEYILSEGPTSFKSLGILFILSLKSAILAKDLVLKKDKGSVHFVNLILPLTAPGVYIL